MHTHSALQQCIRGVSSRLLSLSLHSTNMPLAAVAQLCSRSNVAHNLTKCCDLIARAGRSGAQLLWLPEASDFIAGPADVGRLSRPLHDSDFVRGICTSAQDSRIWVGVGVHESVEGDERRCFNTNLVGIRAVASVLFC